MKKSGYNYFRLTDDDHKDIIRLNRLGQSNGEIDRYIGCTASTVHQHLKREGLHTRHSLHLLIRNEKVRQLYLKGFTAAEIANELNITKYLVYMIAHKLRKDNRL